MKKRVV